MATTARALDMVQERKDNILEFPKKANNKKEREEE